jgi:excisionase family DNA binding protein
LTPLQGGADRLLSVREVAVRLAVHPSTVYELCSRGESHHRVSNAIRIAPQDLQDYLAGRRSDE